MKTTVILLDCDLRNTEGIIYSFGKRGIPIVGISHKKNIPAFKSRFIQKKYYSPHIKEEQAYLTFLLNIEERGVLIYSDDSSAEFISKHQEILKMNGFLVNSPDYETFKRGFEKDKIFIECEKAEVPTISTFIITSFEDLKNAWDDISRRDAALILKPTRLAGGHYFVIRKEGDLLPAYQDMIEKIHSEVFKHRKSGMIAQEFIEYEYNDIYSCDSYYTSDSRSVGFMAIRKDRPDINHDGTPGTRLYAGSTIKNEKLENYTKRLLDSLEWKGFAHVEWIYSPKYQDFLLCEINPRLPGFSNFFTKIGFETAWFYYADLTGEQYKLPIFKKSLYFEALRIPGDITNSLFAVLKGYMKPYDFIKPYLRIFTFQYKVCMDVYFKRDPLFTLTYWGIFIKYLFKRPFRALQK